MLQSPWTSQTIIYYEFIGMIVILKTQHSKALAYIEDHLDTKDAGWVTALEIMAATTLTELTTHLHVYSATRKHGRYR